MNGRFQKGHFHFVYILKFIQKGLILCLLPMVAALLRFDLDSLYTALHQDALILLVMTAVSLLLWRLGGWQLRGNVLELRYGLVSWRRIRIPFDQTAVLEQQRPLWLRILGATRVILYPARSVRPKPISFYLGKTQAAVLAETMMPVQSDAIVFAPTGAERLRFLMLSANTAASLTLLFVSTQQTVHLLGQDVEQQLNHLAMDNFTRLEQLAELFLPAGLAWLFTLFCFLWGFSLLLSLLSNSGFKVSRSGGVILARGGHVNHSERRVRAQTITYCDVRRSPFARLLRRYPVYLCAGSFTGGSIPFLVYKKGQEQLLEALLPGFRLDPLDPGPVRDRSWPMFLWKGGLCLLCSGALVSVSVWQLPRVTPLLIPLVPLSAVLLLFGLEARFREGVMCQPGGSLRICFVRRFTRHDLCVLTPDRSFCMVQTPFSETIGRCNLYLQLPCRQRVRVRGIKLCQAQRLKLID